MQDPVDIAIQFERHLNGPKQSWLLGAGTSNDANVPLMKPLTERVLHVARSCGLIDDDQALHVITFIENDLDRKANLEEFLTHLTDLISLATRSSSKSVVINNRSVPAESLFRIHGILLRILSDTIRWGYRAEITNDDGEVVQDELIGTPESSIVRINHHLAFIRAIFGSTRAGLEEIRSPVEFFTTNYDTLLEDALALSEISFDDGFVGGGVGFWKNGKLDMQRTVQARVTKLHGSVDWYKPPDNPSQLFRVRGFDKYSDDAGTVMIYPQATKYMHTQQDPFAKLFQRFRLRLESGSDHVLLICGYSFGDEHINAEIENALSSPRNQLTLVAFAEISDNELPKALNEWRRNKEWGNQVLAASPLGLYQGASEPVFGNGENGRDWWTFAGVTRLLSEGFPKDVLEQLQ